MAANSLSLILLRRFVTETGGRSRAERALRRYTAIRKETAARQRPDPRRSMGTSRVTVEPTRP